MKKTQKGFTLVELLVVIAILAILATVSVVGYTSFIERAEQSNAETEAHQITASIQSYMLAGMEYVLGTDATGTVYIDANGALKHRATADGAVADHAAVPTTWNDDIAELLGTDGKNTVAIDGDDLVYTYGDDGKVVILADVK